VSHLENFALLDEELEYDPDDGNKAGKSGTQKFTLQAIQAGTAKVQFAKYRPFEPGEVLYEEILLFNVEDTACKGAYGEFGEVSGESREALAEAQKSFAGSDFTPCAVATQIVAGRNYRFAGNISPVTKKPSSYPALVTVYKPLNREAQITEIRKAWEL
jgi:hypothetical protein